MGPSSRQGGARTAGAGHAGYRHEAFLYDGHGQFMGGVLAFLHAAIDAGEPALVVLAAAKLQALRCALGTDAERVLFADMAEVGANPARIIPAWEAFVERFAAPGRRLWGVGEPVHPGRDADELVECQRHEALLNVVFADPAFTLLCPYDTGALPADVIAEARRTHPWVRERGTSAGSDRYPGAEALAAPCTEPLPAAPAGAPSLAFERAAGLDPLRGFVTARGRAAGLPERRLGDLAVAVAEVATNSVVHGGGAGELRIWSDARGVVCEVRDGGRIADPLAGRRRPRPDAAGGRGLWLANQVCDLVQLRVLPSGNAIRLHVRAA